MKNVTGTRAQYSNKKIQHGISQNTIGSPTGLY